MIRVRITAQRTDGKEFDFSAFVAVADEAHALKEAERMSNGNATGIIGIEILSAPKPQPEYTTTSKGICPRCHSYCDGDCTASER